MNQTNFVIQDDKKTLVIDRLFDAGRGRVWAAWTTPDLFAKWWGPRGWETEVKHMDFTDGGYLLYGMKCVDPAQKDWYGKASWGKSTYSNIDAENSFDYTDEFCDENGTVTPGMPVMKIHIEFREEAGKTRIISTSVFDRSEDLEQVIAMGMKEGLIQTWDRLEEMLTK